MDEIDENLLGLLAEDSRQPVTILAKKLGLARTTVQARLERLENSGVIAGYSVRLGQNTRRNRIRASVLVHIDAHMSQGLLGRLSNMPEVKIAHTTSGRFDLILEVVTPDTASMDRLLDRIGALPGVRSSESLIHLRTRIDRSA